MIVQHSVYRVARTSVKCRHQQHAWYGLVMGRKVGHLFAYTASTVRPYISSALCSVCDPLFSLWQIIFWKGIVNLMMFIHLLTGVIDISESKLKIHICQGQLIICRNYIVVFVIEIIEPRVTRES